VPLHLGGPGAMRFSCWPQKPPPVVRQEESPSPSSQCTIRARPEDEVLVAEGEAEHALADEGLGRIIRPHRAGRSCTTFHEAGASVMRTRLLSTITSSSWVGPIRSGWCLVFAAFRSRSCS
jgi:hypothetical protein